MKYNKNLIWNNCIEKIFIANNIIIYWLKFKITNYQVNLKYPDINNHTSIAFTIDIYN